MSKSIDFTKPLTEEDLEYLRDRPWMIEDVNLQGVQVVLASDLEDEDPEEDDTDESRSEEESESEPESEPESEEESEEDGSEEDGSEEESEEDEIEESEDEVPPYSEWEYTELKDELKNRSLSSQGSKEALISRLEEDDSSK